MGLVYNSSLLHSRPITLAKRYLRFYSCHGPYMFDKTSKVLYLIFAVFVPLQLYLCQFLFPGSLHLLPIFKTVTVCHLEFSNFRNFCQNSKHRLFLRRHAKFGEDRTIAAELLILSIFKMADVRHLGFSYFRNICEKFKFDPISTSP